jgi:hypothetical protein
MVIYFFDKIGYEHNPFTHYLKDGATWKNSTAYAIKQGASVSQCYVYCCSPLHLVAIES